MRQMFNIRLSFLQGCQKNRRNRPFLNIPAVGFWGGKSMGFLPIFPKRQSVRVLAFPPSLRYPVKRALSSFYGNISNIRVMSSVVVVRA